MTLGNENNSTIVMLCFGYLSRYRVILNPSKKCLDDNFLFTYIPLKPYNLSHHPQSTKILSY